VLLLQLVHLADWWRCLTRWASGDREGLAMDIGARAGAAVAHEGGAVNGAAPPPGPAPVENCGIFK